MLGASEKSDLNARGAVRKSPKFLLLSSAPASCGFMAEPVGTCQCSPLRFDERAEERAALTEPASSLSCSQVLRGRDNARSLVRSESQ